MTVLFSAVWAGKIAASGDAAPGGWAYTRPDLKTVVTHKGSVPVPEGLLFLRVSDSGTRWAAVGQSSNLVYENGSLYRDKAGKTVSAGWPHPVIYVGETLHIMDAPTWAKTSGFRYVNAAGQIVGVENTTSGPPLWEHTDLGGVSIGQGRENDDGLCVVGADKIVRQLAAQNWRLPNVRYQDGRWYVTAACWADPATPQQIVRSWILTAADLAALPVLTATPKPKPAPAPAPDPVEVPPVPDPILVPNESAFVKSFLGPRLVRIKKADGTPDTTATVQNSAHALFNCAAILHAKDPRWGLLDKGGGNQVNHEATDILAYDLGNGTCQLVDVIGDAEGSKGTPGATWQLVPVSEAGIRPISQWRAPITSPSPVPDPVPTPVPDPGPIPPTPGTPDLSALTAKLAALDARVKALEAKPPLDVTGFALKGGSVQVKGKVAFGDVFGSRELVWDGVILPANPKP